MASLAEELMHTTVRLEGKKIQGTSVGTGFFFMHEQRLFLITNKHVVEGIVHGNFVVLKGKVDGKTKKPLLGQGYRFSFNANNFIGHPNPDVDVAAMNVSAIFSEAENNGDILFWKNLTEREFPTQEQIDKFISPIEEVVFIGYPSGIWDTKNILPIIRKGITATPYYIDFDGQKKFLIDASVFPGSSGSPVFIYYAGGYPDKEGNLYAGNRLHFLGIVAQVYKRVEQGGIRIVNIPTQQLPVAEIDQMIDLGIVFKAETIKECVEYYVNVVNASNNKIQPAQ
ncbi:trypsin-like peptidase domain-containing protein [Hydrogenimonas urashimensis]|uniref:trypsin-like peptidase domain-containing protein n=1 Tax=Hydrogenimonas urashimensis TaxID=2740515 RepID=UPI0019151006|nr:trypsin-like peptidase domain-containing protein [Hydrogenimonas urashimensis]